MESLFLKADKIIPHGEAVALGMIAETHICKFRKLNYRRNSHRNYQNIRRFYPYISIEEFKNEEIINLMINDKKNNHGKINFSLLVVLAKM